MLSKQTTLKLTVVIQVCLNVCQFIRYFQYGYFEFSFIEHSFIGIYLFIGLQKIVTGRYVYKDIIIIVVKDLILIPLVACTNKTFLNFNSIKPIFLIASEDAFDIYLTGLVKMDCANPAGDRPETQIMVSVPYYFSQC